MKFSVYNIIDNLNTVMRRIGYHPIAHSDRGELNCVRPLEGQNYPRFHAYVKEEKDKILFSLHLDQKRPSYGNETAHSGDYEGEVVKKEAYRIQEVLLLSRGQE